MPRIWFLFLGVVIASFSTSWFEAAPINHFYPVVIGALVAPLGFMRYDALGDAERIKKGEQLNYTIEILKRWWLPGIAFIMGRKLGLFWEFTLLEAVWYWIIFDIMINQDLGKPWNYLGKTALLDRIFKYWWIQFSVKLILFGLITYILFSGGFEEIARRMLVSRRVS